MECAIKVGNKYFKDFTSITKGFGGHTQLGCTSEIKQVILCDEKITFSVIGVKNIVGEILNLMRYGEMGKQNIIIEVIE